MFSEHKNSLKRNKVPSNPFGLEGHLCIFSPNHMKTDVKTRFLTTGRAIFSAIPHLCSVFHIVESEKGKILDKHAEF